MAGDYKNKITFFVQNPGDAGLILANPGNIRPEAVFEEENKHSLRSKQQITGEHMKSNARWMVALAVIAGACLNGAMNSMAASSKEVAEATAMMSSYDAEQRAAAAAREKDPAWKPFCDEVGLIQIGDSKKPGTLKNFCLNSEGNILACFGAGIRVYSPKGELLKTLPLEIKPGAICAAKDGSVFVAGDGRLLKLDATGKVLA